MNQPATYQLDGRIATIALDDGKVNALSLEMLRGLHSALDQAERDLAIVVLAGREGCFSAGFDLKLFAAGGDAAVEMVVLGATLSERLMSFPTPVVIACTGHSVAAGAFLLLAADLRIGADGPFQIALNEVRIGLTLPWFVIELARHRLNRAHFDRAVVTAAAYTPGEAVTAGFLDKIVPAGELRAAAIDAAKGLAELNGAAHAATKLRTRAGTLKAIRRSIESELTIDSLGGGRFKPA